jgi:hypothetical protein
MKHMLRNSSLVLLFLAVIGTLAFTNAPAKATKAKALAGTQFLHDPFDSDPHDPDTYIPVPSGFDPDIDCPGALYVCAIETTQIYTSGPFTGLPKVDTPCGPGTICKRIDDVLANHSLEGQADANGNIVWLILPQ